MLGDMQWQALADPADGSLEPLVAEWLQAPTGVTHEMVMMPGAVARRLIPQHTATDLHPLQETELIELLHDPVDARTRDHTLAHPQLALDLDGRQGARLLVEQLEDGPASTATPVARLGQPTCSPLRPG